MVNRRRRGVYITKSRFFSEKSEQRAVSYGKFQTD